MTTTLSQPQQSTKTEGFSSKLKDIRWQTEFTLISYGVCIGIRVNNSIILERLQDFLPPGWKKSSLPVVEVLYSLIVEENHYQLYRNQEKIIEANDLEKVLLSLDSDLRIQVGILVKDWLFVHAGVVGWCNQAIVIPGRSFSGKTTLVAALVKAGATYYSDEYAVFDSHGLVYPYPRLLSMRQKEGVKRCSVKELGGQTGTEPLPVAMVVHTQYQPGYRWNPRKMSPGQAALSLLDNTIVARLRPEFALPILSCAVSDAVAVEGKRGEAEVTAVEILQQIKVL